MNQRLDRIPPQSLEAEVAVLGAILQDGGALRGAADLLRAEHFYKDAHRRAFAAALALHDRGVPVDLLTLTEELRLRGDLEATGGPAALAALLEAVPTAANVTYHARIVRDKALLRQLIATASELVDQAHNGFDPADLRGRVERFLETIPLEVDRRDATVGTDAFLAPPPELTWDIDGVRLQGDHGWTSASPKSMKGLFSLEEARACATGTPFLGHFAARKTTALYVSEEDRPARLHRRVHAMLVGRPPEEIPGPEDLRFLVKAGVRLDTTEGIGVLRGHLERYRPDLVFLEHFDRLHSKNIKHDHEVKPLLDELDALNAEFGCTFRLQKHHRKEAAGQSKRTGEMISGSVALFGWGESSVYLTLLRKGVAQVEVEAKDGDTAPRFLVEYQGGRLVYGGEVKADRKAEARERVLNILDQHPGATTAEVAEALKVTTRTATTRLRELEAAGAVVGNQETSRAPKRWSRNPRQDKG